jgi:hypothetical protein
MPGIKRAYASGCARICDGCHKSLWINGNYVAPIITGAEARFLLPDLDAALKRRSSTVLTNGDLATSTILVRDICHDLVFLTGEARAHAEEFSMRSRRLLPKTLAAMIVLALSVVARAQTAGPLIVDQKSHLVVMEYENWFGPNAVTFQGAAAMPFLQSPDMQSVGGGYDSADPAVIKKHVEWFEDLGIDAALIDLTNNVSCIFNSEWFIKKYLPGCTPSFRSSMQTIRDNTGKTYPSWTNLGTNLKLIPLLGGSVENVLYKDQNGKTALEKEIDYFGGLMNAYPDREVIYQGKPLMLIFLGAAQDPNPSDNPEWYQIRKFLKAHPEIEGKYTFKEMAGYLDSQPYLWATKGTPTGPIEINPLYSFWSWVDRLNPTCTVQPYCPYYPSYTRVDSQAGSRVENFTASIATAGQNGWGCPNENSLPYCPDASLRYGADGSYATVDAFMNEAAQLDPIFLIIHQFNEFVPPDEGFNANTDDDIEPANLWGNDLPIVKRQIELYRQKTASAE